MKAIIFAGEKGRCVIYGEIDAEEIPMPEQPIRIRNARMILRVAEVGYVGIGSSGPLPGTDTRITRSVPETTCTVRQAIECTQEAAAAIDAWPDWR